MSPARRIHSHQLLLNAAEFLKGYLGSQQKERGAGFAAWLEETYFAVVDRFTLLVYEVDSKADTGVVFETMNDRGKRLTELEKVKNYLLYLASKLVVESRRTHASDQHDLAAHLRTHHAGGSGR